ncbi:Uncharacterized protein TCM_036999 [Theobroma cacao]|uniref:Tetratricopeptide repeat-like superfamily protein n=1 Tax=Theobroma cacao TaxID=3641 RepID=A0A061GIW4_THECC|nr:Uncharacterized protein TCM_036999 [Theobroma cacao]
MLLRSSSPPVLTTCIPQSSPAVDSSRRLPSKPIALTASSINKIQRTSPECNMRQMAIPRQKLPSGGVGVRGDLLKAEEYCERAILVKPDDGEVLSMYGDLIWINHGDGARALYYSHRAAQASPDDYHVLASYARLEWAAGKEEEEEEEDKAKER